jgi:hypothetical protein
MHASITAEGFAMNPMTTMFAHGALGVSSVLLCAAALGCGPGKGEMLRARAVTDLGCAEQQLTTNSLMPYVENVSGCGKQDVYAYDHGQSKWVSLRERAAFELSCDKSAIEISVLDTVSYGAVGCDRRVVYKFLWGTGFVANSASDALGGAGTKPAATAEPAATAAPSTPK